MEDLLQKIRTRRQQLLQYIRRQEPRNRLLINLAILCGIAGTALAGIPAIGGTSAINGIKSVTETRLPIWQLLCIGASLCTMIATIATTLRNNHDTSGRLSKAQSAVAKLELLDLLLAGGQIEPRQAIEKFGEYTAEVSFISRD